MISLFKRLWPLVVVILASYFAIAPLFHPGFFPMHDNTQVQRVYEMEKALKDGQFPVRWIQDLGYGYGYPLFNFYAPLAYYIGGLFALLGINALIATKFMFAGGIIFSGVTMYLFANALWGKKAGILSGIVYIYATYHAVDIYVRGDVAEFYAYAFIPLAFLGFYKIYQTIYKSYANFQAIKWVIIASVGFAGIILSHNLTALMVTPFLLAFSVILFFFSRNKLIFSFHIVSSLFVALAISAFYWLPVFGEMQYTNVLSQVGGTADFHNHFVCLEQLWYSPWGYGGSVPGCIDGLSFMLGKLPIILTIIGIIGLFLVKKTRRTGLMLSIGLLVSLFLTIDYSVFVWNNIKLMAFLQYPWRFLLLAWFFLSLIIGSIVYVLGEIKIKYTIFVTTVLVILILFFQQKFFTPQTYLKFTPNHYINTAQLTWTTSKISDEYMPKNFQKPVSFNEVPKSILGLSKGKVIIVKNTSQEKILVTKSEDSQTLQIHLAYFPAWRITIDQNNVPIEQFSKGIEFSLPAGIHTVKIHFSQTPIEQIGNLLSLGGLAILVLGIIILVNKAYEEKNS